jgi:DNA-directed RNA polymerase specialized sigma24 family protein
MDREGLKAFLLLAVRVAEYQRRARRLLTGPPPAEELLTDPEIAPLIQEFGKVLTRHAKSHPRHPRTGRLLRWEEINVLTAAVYAAKPKLRREELEEDAFRRPKGAVLRDKYGEPLSLRRHHHSIWTIEDVLRFVLGIHEGLKASRKLWNYMVAWGLHREYGVMDLYAIALTEVANTVNEQKLRANKPSWLDNEFAIRYLHASVRMQGWKLAYEIVSSRQGWGRKNWLEALEDFRKLPRITWYKDGVLVGGNGRKRYAPAVDYGGDQAVAEAVWRQAFDLKPSAATYEDAEEESALEAVAQQRAQDHDRRNHGGGNVICRTVADHLRIREQIRKTPGTKIVSPPVLDREPDLIAEERAYWTQATGGKAGITIGIPCHNGPYMESGALQFWDVERQAKKRVPELTTQQRRVAVLRLIGGLSNEQAAHVTGISESAVRSHASDANKRLRGFGEEELVQRGAGRE